MLEGTQDLLGYREALARGELAGQRCGSCDRHWWPPRPACPHCGSVDFDWIRLPDFGNLYTWTVVAHPSLPEFEDKVPYTVGVVEFADIDIRVIGYVDENEQHLEVGMPLAWKVNDQNSDDPPFSWIAIREDVGVDE